MRHVGCRLGSRHSICLDGGSAAEPSEGNTEAAVEEDGWKTLRLLRSLTSLWHLWRVRREEAVGEINPER